MSRHLLLSLSVAACSIILPFAAHAQTAPVAGDLIKASGSTVYYLGADAKRYVFPTEKTYFTWYADFSTVKSITDSQLATYQIAGNVTYRPGVRLVKITTDPKVYAVAHGGELRWVQTEAIALALYGNDWAKKVDDVPDAFFINYHIGAPIVQASEFLPAQQQADATTIAADRWVSVPTTVTPPVTPPAATSTVTYTAEIASSQANPLPGTTIQLVAYAHPDTGLNRINVLYDGQIQNTCTTSPCTALVSIPQTVLKNTFEMRTEISWAALQTASATGTVTVSDKQNAAITLTLAKPELRPNTTRDVVVSMSPSFTAASIEISIDNAVVQACDGAQSCHYTGWETSTTGTIHSVYAIAYNANGVPLQSDTKTFKVVDNEHPIVTVEAGKYRIYPGETVDVTVSAQDDNAIASTELWYGSTLLKRCNASICTTITGPWNGEQLLQFIGKATDDTGLWAQATSSQVVVRR